VALPESRGPKSPKPLNHIETTGSVTVQWLRDPAELARHADEWRALEQSATHTHLSSYDFITAWYRHYAGSYGGAPLIGLARKGSRLVGVAPLAICRGRIGTFPVTRIEVAPTDVPAGELLAAGGDHEVISAFVDALVDDIRFDVISLDGFAAGSDEMTAVEHAASKRRIAVECVDHAYAIADLSSGYDSYRAQLSGHFRRNLNQRARKIAAAGGAEVSGIQFSGDLDELERGVSRIIAITEASYKLQGERLADCHRTFLSEIVPSLSERGTLCLPILSIGGQDAAFILGVVERGVFYDITLAYAEPFAKVSPGSFLMQRTLEMLASAGVHTVVSHGAHDYKKHWATRFVPQKRLLLFNRGVRGTAARFIRFSLAPLWQRLRGVEHAADD
jgi:CelD/BcsL family acetyltransferase involved in cellulose biosynthesis